MNKSIFLPKNNAKCEKIFGIIKLVSFIIGVCLLILAVFKIVHWSASALAIFFYCWNVRQYHIGCFSHVVNNDRKRGYPRKGLHRVYQSWKVFMLVIVLVVIAVIVTP